ncbi:uncharacterized protein BJ171DRAFT_421111 [Polychytrium aggregatum]|uniref:uncharacterized protein n=1 Tax=Polychytrium aggregatum TaxID=110093 RepID=UPI0022FDEE86|nr:uncharacterized protein BJ171DRAFT_421111 [Polychytrium aggregatum]KAI9207407.1 hypothetical protein BJ171DRAFT_421111 [Polychytrium aggregatum]
MWLRLAHAPRISHAVSRCSWRPALASRPSVSVRSYTIHSTGSNRTIPSNSSNSSIPTADADDSSPQLRDLSKYTNVLEREGFTTAQAEALLTLIIEGVDESMQNISKSMTTKDEQRHTSDEINQEFSLLRSEIQSLSQRDFAKLRSEIEKVLAEVNKMKESIQDGSSRVHAGIMLDVNLDKGRIKDEAQQLTQMVEGAEKRIDLEVDALKERLDKIKRDMKSGLSRK